MTKYIILLIDLPNFICLRASKATKKQAVAEKPRASGGNIQAMLANMPTKKRVAQAKVDADELLENLMGEIESEPAKKPTISSKDYLKSFSVSIVRYFLGLT